jgi:hypothetical protein
MGPAKNSPRDRPLDNALYQGVTARELALLFKMKPDTVKTRLGGLKASGERFGYPLYHIKDAAPFLVPIPADVISAVMKINHKSLPPSLQREYWYGQNARLKFETDKGNLWKTQDVVMFFADAFSDVRMGILLLLDRVERETAFTDRQREALQSIIDGTLEDIRGRIENTFQARRDQPAGRPGPDEAADDEPGPVYREPSLDERAAGL